MKRWHEETTLMKSRWREELKTHGYNLDLSLRHTPPPGSYMETYYLREAEEG